MQVIKHHRQDEPEKIKMFQAVQDERYFVVEQEVDQPTAEYQLEYIQAKLLAVLP